MVSIIKQPVSPCFSSMADDIVFRTDAENGVLTLDLICSGTRINIIDDTMYPDLGGCITVGDVSSLVEPYARQYLNVTLECSFEDESGSISISPVTVLYAKVDVGTTASWFTTNHFLTVLNGEKLTAVGREERLFAYGSSSVSVSADVETGAGAFEVRTAQLNAASTSDSISQFDVSPSNIVSLLALTSGRLLGYTVTSGNRTQQFRVVEDHVLPAPSLLFVNSFGCMEFLHCVGTHKKESKYERKSTRVRGRLKNYRVNEDRQFTANTGWLNEGMADWADELFRSDEIYLWVNGQRGREVIVSESKSEITNEDDNMPAFEFTYTYAQRIHNVMQPSHAGRIFDNTFDHTFN